MTPVRLTDDQMSAVLAASHPLPADCRSDFLPDVARTIAELPEVGDGSLHRIVVEVQRRYFDPPCSDDGSSNTFGGKYSR